MTAEQLTTVILGILGALLQLVLKYAPRLSAWYKNHANKGAIALAASVAIGAVYYGLACTPYAGALNITLTCDQNGAFVLLKSIFIIASTQQLAYLYTRN